MGKKILKNKYKNKNLKDDNQEQDENNMNMFNINETYIMTQKVRKVY